MNLVFFAPNSVGGVRTYINNLCCQLVSSDFNVKVVYYGFSDVKYSNNSFETVIILSEFDNQRSSFNKLKDLIEFNDTIIASDSMELEMYNYFRLKNRLVFIMHGDNAHYSSLIKYPFIDNILCVSKSLAKKYSQNVNSVINPIVSDGTFNNCPLSETLKIAFIGRLEDAKGANLICELDNLINADWQFYIPQENSDFRFIDKIKSKNIFLDSSNKNLISSIVECNFIFFPSISEGFGIAVLEAMKNGVIPIVRNIDSGIMADLTDNQNCLKFENIQDIVSKINWLKRNKNEYDLLRKNVFEFSIKEYNKDQIIEKFSIMLSQSGIANNKEYLSVNKPIGQYLPNWIYRPLKRLKYAIN